VGLSRFLAAQVRTLRAQRGLSARRLADLCQDLGQPSLTRGTIAKIESGVRGAVTFDEAVTLARALGVALSDLVPPVPAAEGESGPREAISGRDQELVEEPTRDETDVDFLISYTSDDGRWANWIGLMLKKEEYRVLLHAIDSPPKTNWFAAMEAGIRRAARTVVVLSEQSARSVYGHAGWQAAWAADRSWLERTMVARVTDCTCPGVLSGVFSFDLFGVDETAAVEELLRMARLSASGGHVISGGKPSPRPNMRPAPAPDAFPGSARASSGRVLPSAEALPALPSRFVARDDAVAAVRALLTDPVGGPVVGLVGMGGAGKSMLARAVVHDPRVQEAFPDGVVWVEVNREPDIAAVVSAALAAFGDAAPVLDAAEGSGRLRGLLAEAACLLVLDDVWQVDVLRLLPLSGRARLLVTTRCRDALFTDSAVYEVGAADEGTAMRVLAAHAGCRVRELPAEAKTIASRCGGLVLALALVGGMAGDGVPWANASERLRRADLGRLAGRFADYPHPNLLAALEAGVTALPADEAERFRELGVFKGRGPVPAAVVVRLWQATAEMDALDADDLLRMFARRSLVQVDPQTDTVTVHDLLFDYARSSLVHGRLPALHRLLAEDFLHRWGGLDRRLPGLRGVVECGDADRYGVGALVWHLLGAGRWDLVDAVLALEWPTGTGRTENAWYTVHENLGLTRDYLAGIRAVWRDAEARTDQAGAAGPGTGGVDREIDCALVISSIASIAANIPPALLPRLVEEGVWPRSRALAYARATPDPVDRARALGGLAAHLPDDERGPVLARAVKAAAAIDNPVLRAEELGRLAAHLPADERGPVLAQAVEAAAVGNPVSRAEALGGLATHLPAGPLAQAVEAAAVGPVSRARALGGLAAHLPADERGPVLARALEAATAIGSPVSRAEALGGLAAHLPDHERGPVLARAVEAATAIDSPSSRAEVLGGLAAHLPADERGPVLARPMEAAVAIDDSDARAVALGGLAAHLPADERGPVLAQAVEAAAAIDSPVLRAEALGGLAAHLPDHERGPVLARAVEAATAIDSPSSRAEALGGLAAHLPDDERGPVLDRAVEAAAAIDDSDARAVALGGLAAHLPDDERGPVLARAVEAAAAIDSPFSRARALGGLAAYLPADERGPVLDRAVEAAAAVDIPFSRAEALGGLAAHLPEDERGPVLDRAVEAAAVGDPVDRARALGELAAHLPDDLLARAAKAAAAIDDPDSRARALIAIALAESRNRAADDPRHWRAALRAAAQVNRDRVVAALPAVLARVSPTIAGQAAESLIRAQRWWP
jgi:transcriptional regulator with XRE-family HTH domain